MKVASRVIIYFLLILLDRAGDSVIFLDILMPRVFVQGRGVMAYVTSSSNGRNRTRYERFVCGRFWHLPGPVGPGLAYCPSGLCFSSHFHRKIELVDVPLIVLQGFDDGDVDGRLRLQPGP